MFELIKQLEQKFRTGELNPRQQSWFGKNFTYLLEKHYGLTLNDMPLCEESVIQAHIDAGITLVNAVNFLVKRYELVRIDRNGN